MDEISMIVDACKFKLNLKSASLGKEYYYNSLTLCIIDSVFSIGVTYDSTRNTVDRYCKYYEIDKYRKFYDSLPKIADQESVKTFNEKINTLGIEKFTNEIFQNKQRTSTKNGILKTEAAYLFSNVLLEHKVNYFQDVQKAVSNPELEKAIKKISGQGTGLSLQYFFMLSGSENLIKPDRMVLRFIEEHVGRKYSREDAQLLLMSTLSVLRNSYPHLNLRLLDNKIWNYQRRR